MPEPSISPPSAPGITPGTPPGIAPAPGSPSRVPVENEAVADRVTPLREVLDQLRRLLDQLDASIYNAKPVTTYGGSVGGHVRHCLDHVNALLQGAPGNSTPENLIDYEARQRGTEVETDVDAARAELDRLDAALAALPEDALECAVTTAIFLAADRPALHAPSSLAREVAFVLSHTIHHNAMIGGMVKALGGDVPADFGMAPGTLRHQQQARA